MVCVHTCSLVSGSPQRYVFDLLFGWTPLLHVDPWLRKLRHILLRPQKKQKKQKQNLSFHIFNRTKEMFSRTSELVYCIQYNLMVCVCVCVCVCVSQMFWVSKIYLFFLN